MNSKFIKSSLYLNLLTLSIIIAGCGQNSYNKRYFVLDATRQAEKLPQDKEIILEVHRFAIDSAFESKGLVYRKGEFEYESDFYNEFLISPAEMITEKTRNWLSASGIFARVLDKGSYAEPTHTLQGNITALYGDFRDKSTQMAVMEIRVFLTANADSIESIVLSKTYTASFKLESKTTENLIKTFEKCLIQILTDLEKDLKAKLSAHP